ncbi:xylan 1,4-beta-xylosidase [Sphingobium indicum IP26]|uniref:Xylan 1,4-beta-xylosidase n=2 Tax=Sphingobium indicum TaxID=332055 RepID=A0A8E0WQZ0_9SPHN|nr:xylan 1,4-beta-xylosidase [Sphingobium indicum IP26]EQB05785.1 xylan 1,4-beta-xylosidase [Sphingobium sp. HDIP04]KER35789.1 xylan 1,4-beta-xylosidase [Sphingobium indicum F2]
MHATVPHGRRFEERLIVTHRTSRFSALPFALLSLFPAAATAAMAAPARFDRFTYEGTSMEQVAVRPGEYRNPILTGYYPDPSVMRVGDDYYLVNSSFAHYPGLPIFKSKDLVNWTQIGNAIDRPEQLDFNGRRISQAVFAPDISHHDGTFYIVNTCVECGGNFVITAKDPAGPWSNPVWLPFEGIDPSIYWEGDKAYIVNNRAPDEPPRYDGHRAIWIQEFDWRAGRMVGESTQIVNGGVDIGKKPVWIEGPHIFRKDGYYYLTAAEGGTSVNHSQVVFRAKELRGPYTPYEGNPILTQRDLDPARPDMIGSAGHAELVQTQKGDWWATFLAVRPYDADDHYNIGRETFLLPVEWKDGWPIILPRGRAIPHALKAPALPAQPKPPLPTSGDFSYVEEFDGQSLPMQWIGIRTPRKPFYRLRGGALELESGAAVGDLGGVPAFIGRRQQHSNATFSTTLRYRPTKDGDRAGLAAVQSDRSNLFFGLTRIAGKPAVALYTRDAADADTLVASAPVATNGPITLTMRVTGGTMAFDYAVGGRKATLKEGLDATLLSTRKAGGFVGTVVGPYRYTPAS